MAATARLAILAVLLAASWALCAAQTKPKAPAAKAAPGPAGSGSAADAGPPTDINKLLAKHPECSKFMQLLHDTRVDTQVNAQLTDSYNGLTILAPTDAAYDKLKAGVLNGLSPQEQIQMVLYCIMPRFYSLSMLGTLNGKVTTQGSGKDGTYKFDIRRTGNNVNVSTGVKGNSFLLGSPMSKEFPLAVYPVDKVPLPYELFGPKPPTPAPAPAPAPAKSKTKKKKKSGIAEPPAADDSTAADSKNAAPAPAAAGRWVAALSVLGAAVLGGGLF